MSARPCVKLFQLAALCVILTMGILPATPTSASSSSARVIELTTAKRRAIMGRRCPALVYNPALAAAAQAHAGDMAARNYFSHTGRSGSTGWQRVKAAGYSPSRIAENIAGGQPSPEAVVAGWMRSRGHRANILDCRLREIGVGVAEGGRYGVYWVQVFGARR